MTDLSQRLSAWISSVPLPTSSCGTPPITHLYNALTAVLNLHKPFHYDYDPDKPVCSECRDDEYEAVATDWPCRTIFTIAETLGITDGD